ncbi:uncharacterized protein L201_008078 [Kwoniella dendrophila CBS 6074]|uniref:Cytoplasmic protein n=1 Tax=Kwoniella dendrophila CBS 6074 TaxID=1295534 RepID=A0AAX4K6D1_9TREE
MTFRSRSGGPVKKRGPKKQTHTRKLHHPPPPKDKETEEEEDKPKVAKAIELAPLPNALESGPFNPPDTEILALLNRSLNETLSSDEFIPTIQKIKSLLYEKKWLQVFESQDEFLLESYTGRWVPSRICCFRELMDKLVKDVFTGIDQDSLELIMRNLQLEDKDDEEEEEENEDEEGNDSGSEDGDIAEDKDKDEDDNDEENEEEDEDDEGAKDEETSNQAESSTHANQKHHNILSLGGGAGSELLAISALIRSVLIQKPQSHPRFTWTGIDIGNWSNVLMKLEDTVKSDWKIDESILEIDYIQANLLSSSSIFKTTSPPNPAISAPTKTIDILTKTLIDKPPKLITLFFTLTELLTQNRSKTLSLLNKITENVSPGTLFLIVDSASDISDFELGSSQRKYPIYMIIDALLLSPSPTKQDKSKNWKKLKSENSRWFRFNDSTINNISWKVKLENTRYWYRLYQKI